MLRLSQIGTSTSLRPLLRSLENNREKLKKIKELKKDPLDFEFLAKELNIDKSVLLTQYKEQRNNGDGELLHQLQKVLKDPMANKVIQYVIADMKSSFDLPSKYDMNKKNEEMKQNLDLKIGDKKVTPKDAEFVENELMNNPYWEFRDKVDNLISLFRLSHMYHKRDIQGLDEFFEKNMGEEGRLVSGTDADKEQESMIELIKSGELLKYFDNVMENARLAVDPEYAAKKKLEAESEEKYNEDIKMAKIRKEIIEYEKKEIEYTRKAFNSTLDDSVPLEDINSVLRDIKTRKLELTNEVALDPELDIFKPAEDQQQAKDPKEDLKYYFLYPKKVRKWIDYSHTPLGLFTQFGVWYNLPEWYAKHFKPSPPENFITGEKSSGSTSFTKPDLPEDLRNVYRFGVSEDEIKLLDPKLQEFLSYRYASQKEVNFFRKQQCIKKFGKNNFDTGNTSVQIACMTEKLNYLEAHMKKNRKDFVAKRHFGIMESRRKSMIEYLKNRDVEEYFRVTKELKLRNV
eukprot:gene4799-5984_t